MHRINYLLQNTNIIFVILGDGSQKQQLIQYVVEKKIDNVKFHDTVGKQEVQAFLQHCDLLLNPWLKNKIIYKRKKHLI